MIEIIVRQAEKRHDTNQLHDALAAAGLNPWPVVSTAEESSFCFESEEDAGRARAVIEAHIPAQPQQEQPSPTASLITALAGMNLDGVATVDDLKAAIEPVRSAAVAIVSSGAQLTASEESTGAGGGEAA